MAGIHEITRACGVKLLAKKGTTPHILKPKTTYSRATIRNMIKEDGEEHAQMVLKAIISAPHNETELYGDTIKGVSLWLSVSEIEPKHAGDVAALLATTSLSELRAQVKEVRLGNNALRMADRLSSILQNENTWLLAA